MPPAPPPAAGRLRALGGTLALTGILGALGLTGCTQADSPPDPVAAATALADGLASGQLATLRFDGATGEAATASVRNAVGGLADVPRNVRVVGVTRKPGDDDTATATLGWTWTVPSTAGWSYQTQATLHLAEDKSWHVTWTPTLVEPTLTAAEHFTLERRQGARGSVLDGDGNVLVGLRDVYRVGIDKGRIPAEQAAASATALAQLMGIDPAAYVKLVGASGAKQFVPAITLRVDDPRIAGHTEAVQAIPGGAAIADQAMLAPSATFARAVLGTVGPATAEIVAKSGGRVGATDTVGLSGLQARYDAYLAGSPGLTVRAVGNDAAGAATSRTLFTEPPVPGRSLSTMLEPAAQNAAEAALAGTTVPAALVAIRPSTGEIVASANGPATAGLDVADSGHAAPGSTFKLVTSLALLRAGLTPDSPLPCNDSVTVDGRVFGNYADYAAGHNGTIPLRLALAYSCNTAYISQHDLVSQDDLADAAAALGVGVSFDTGFGGFLGSVPRAATATEHAASMIGQGKVEVSALAVATIAASIVNGSTVVPRLVERPPADAPTSATGPTSATSATSAASSVPTAPPPPAKPLTAAEAEALRAMMRGVVTDGTARSLAAAGVVGAKTGTAEYGTETPPRTHAWIVGFRGDLAVAVYVEDGQSGSGTAGPLLAAFLRAYAG